MLNVVYRPEAEAELLDAVSYYGTEDTSRGDKFLQTIHRHVLEIAEHPMRFPTAGGAIRRCVVRKYPFIIFYRPTRDHVRILAIAHTSRNPEYWKSRT
jgi:toxin ParE1/3/4